MKACLSRLISYLGKPGSLRGTLKAVGPSVYCVNLGTLFCAQLWHIMKEYGETVFIWSPLLPPHPPTHPYSCLLNLKVTEVMTRTFQTHGFYLFLQRISSDICIKDIIYLSNELHAYKYKRLHVKYNWRWVASIQIFLSFSPAPHTTPQLSSRKKIRGK